MQSFTQLRRLAALIPFALALGAGARPAGAQAQQAVANAIPVVSFASPGDLEDAPRNVRASLMLANDGNIYFGSTGGGEGAGAIARLTPDGELSVVHALEGEGSAGGSEGVSVWSRLIQASDGHLYGTAFIGGEEGLGTLFRVTLDGAFTVLHHFGGGHPNPERPYAGVTEASDGNLYGTTLYGGQSRKGTIYRIAKDGTGFTVVHEFRGSDGENPEGDLVERDGYLYGTTMKGGSGNRGTVFRMSLSGDHEVLYSFPELGRFRNGVATNSTGADPRAGLMLGADGNFYGTAYQGGAHGHGTVFRITPGGELTVLHHFAGASFDGAGPLAPLTQDAQGNIYGTTQAGGSMNQGSAWRLAPDGTFTLLHSFHINAHGVTPYAGILPAHGTLYAVTYYDYLDSFGGSIGAGSILKLDVPESGPPLLQMSASATQIEYGQSVTISWNWTGPADWTCAKIGGSVGWPGDTTVSGSQSLQPAPASYAYGIRCTEPDDGDEDTPRQARTAQVAVVVNAPVLAPLDGGTAGSGSLSLWWLLLAASLLICKVLKERRSSCP
jgi:uncharacterized repeat protein (TIGR03803 family)